jgi:hypothetical protein
MSARGDRLGEWARDRAAGAAPGNTHYMYTAGIVYRTVPRGVRIL